MGLDKSAKTNNFQKFLPGRKGNLADIHCTYADCTYIGLTVAYLSNVAAVSQYTTLFSTMHSELFTNGFSALPSDLL